MTRRIAGLAAAVVLGLAGQARGALRLTVSHRDAIRTARAYAAWVDPSTPTISCRRDRCHVSQLLSGGDFAGYNLEYKVTVTRLGPHRLGGWSVLFGHRVTIRD